MKNQEYWAKRKADLIYQQMDKAEKQADKFDKVYQEAKIYLDKEVNKIFDKFQRDYGLSQVDARQVLKNMKDKKDLKELRKVLEARPNDPNIQRLLADLDSPAYSFRMKRLERLSDDLDRMRESIYRSEKTGSDAFYSDLMKDSYYKATFDLQQQTGLAYGFSGLPESEIKHLQSFSWVGDGSTYSTDIWKNTGKLTSSIKDELLMSLMTGRGTRETAQAIAERFNVGQNDARRLVRTESAFFHNQMELLSYEEADIEKYIFVAVLDKRTSRICQKHDNQVYDRDKAVPGVNCPPMHPWCRSTTVGYDEDADYSKLKRRARNPVTGKTELVPADMTYKEWYSKYVMEPREQELSGRQFGADLDYVRSDEFVDKLKNNPKTSHLSEPIARVSRQMLQHRNGTPFEDYYLLNADTGRVVALSNKARKTKGVVYNDQVRKAFKEQSEQSLISIHNHPSGYPPSLSDFASLQQRSKNNTVKYGLTIGHDGSVYWYTRPNKRIPKIALSKYSHQIEKFKKMGYNEVIAQEKTLEMFSNLFEFEFGRID